MERPRVWILMGLALLAAAGCRVRSAQQPYWVETHGRGVFRRLAAAPLGAAALGTDGLLYSYPTPSSAWRPWPADLRPLVVTGSRSGVHTLDQEGRLMHIGADGAPVLRAQIDSGQDVAALAVGTAGEVHVLRDGKLWRLDGAALVAGPCASVRAVALAAVGAKLWISDGQSLHATDGIAAESACARAPGPDQVVRLSGNAERLLALDRAGNAHLRGSDGQWQVLPRPRKYRPDQSFPARAMSDVALGPTFAWALDDEGAVFLLSDPRNPP